MCGINGFTFPDEKAINLMNQSILHRGPDDNGIYTDRNISLGNVRLAIVDLSPKGHMPMEDRSNRYVITFNGEIYNYQKLRQELETKGYTFISSSDTEVILNLFIEEGEKCFRRLNGMFAVAIWDKKEKRLVLARDRVGIKPLYYTLCNNKLYFSSEIKALFCHKLQRKLNKQAVDLYFRLLYVPAPLSIFENIFKVLPGEILVWQKNKLKHKTYWEPDYNTRFHGSKEEAKAQMKTLLSQSVKQQLIADRPVGIFLSGGIDSTTVLALASASSSVPIKTFSVGFSEVAELPKFNADFELARRSAHYYGAKHHEYTVSPQEALVSFQKLVASMDEPNANPTHIPTQILAEGSVKEVTVALGGDGGDELFGGYDRYLDGLYFDWYEKIPAILRKNITDRFVKKIKPTANIELLYKSEATTSAEKYLTFLAQNEVELTKIYSSNSNQVLQTLSTLRGFNNRDLPFHEQLPFLDFLYWLPEESLMRSDKMTMLSSLEQRVPFLDNEVIDLAFSLPFSWKVTRKLRKKILRDAFSDILPDFILNAPKRGFFSPAAKWLRDPEWKAYTKDILSPANIDKTGLLNSNGVTQMLTKHISGEKYNMQLVWAVLTFIAWERENFLSMYET